MRTLMSATPCGYRGDRNDLQAMPARKLFKIGQSRHLAIFAHHLANHGGGGKTGEPGEIVVAGPQIMLGYWGRPDAGNETFVPDASGKLWLRTGDVGTIDAGIPKPRARSAMSGWFSLSLCSVTSVSRASFRISSFQASSLPRK